LDCVYNIIGDDSVYCSPIIWMLCIHCV